MSFGGTQIKNKLQSIRNSILNSITTSGSQIGSFAVATWNTVTAVTKTIIKGIAFSITNPISTVTGIVKIGFAAIVAPVKYLYDGIKNSVLVANIQANGLIKGIGITLRDSIKSFWNGIKNGFMNVIGAVKNNWKSWSITALKILGSPILIPLSLITTPVKQFFSNVGTSLVQLKNIWSYEWNSTQGNVFKKFWASLKLTSNAAVTMIEGGWKNMLMGMLNGVKTIGGAIKNGLVRLGGALKQNFAGSLPFLAMNVVEGISNGFDGKVIADIGTDFIMMINPVWGMAAKAILSVIQAIYSSTKYNAISGEEFRKKVEGDEKLKKEISDIQDSLLGIKYLSKEDRDNIINTSVTSLASKLEQHKVDLQGTLDEIYTKIFTLHNFQVGNVGLDDVFSKKMERAIDEALLREGEKMEDNEAWYSGWLTSAGDYKKELLDKMSIESRQWVEMVNNGIVGSMTTGEQISMIFSKLNEQFANNNIKIETAIDVINGMQFNEFGDFIDGLNGLNSAMKRKIYSKSGGEDVINGEFKVDKIAEDINKIKNINAGQLSDEALSGLMKRILQSQSKETFALQVSNLEEISQKLATATGTDKYEMEKKLMNAFQKIVKIPTKDSQGNEIVINDLEDISNFARKGKLANIEKMRSDIDRQSFATRNFDIENIKKTQDILLANTDRFDLIEKSMTASDKNNALQYYSDKSIDERKNSAGYRDVDIRKIKESISPENIIKTLQAEMQFHDVTVRAGNREFERKVTEKNIIALKAKMEEYGLSEKDLIKQEKMLEGYSPYLQRLNENEKLYNISQSEVQNTFETLFQKGMYQVDNRNFDMNTQEGKLAYYKEGAGLTTQLAGVTVKDIGGLDTAEANKEYALFFDNLSNKTRKFSDETKNAMAKNFAELIRTDSEMSVMFQGKSQDEITEVMSSFSKFSSFMMGQSSENKKMFLQNLQELQQNSTSMSKVTSDVILGNYDVVIKKIKGALSTVGKYMGRTMYNMDVSKIKAMNDKEARRNYYIGDYKLMEGGAELNEANFKNFINDYAKREDADVIALKNFIETGSDKDTISYEQSQEIKKKVVDFLKIEKNKQETKDKTIEAYNEKIKAERLEIKRKYEEALIVGEKNEFMKKDGGGILSKEEFDKYLLDNSTKIGEMEFMKNKNKAEKGAALANFENLFKKAASSTFDPVLDALGYQEYNAIEDKNFKTLVDKAVNSKADMAKKETDETKEEKIKTGLSQNPNVKDDNLMNSFQTQSNESAKLVQTQFSAMTDTLVLVHSVLTGTLSVKVVGQSNINMKS